eukprot:5759931-Karenia_brevis.AAC.1
MASEDFEMALQKRFGARVNETEMVCRLCGEIMDPCMTHTDKCAQAECTRGHYAVARAYADGLALADSNVQLEVRGLSETDLRPADIYTNAAVPGFRAALDVTVMSADAGHAGLDACTTGHKNNFRKYSHILGELRAEG